MYTPTESDHYHEWIELYNPTNTSINVQGWTLWDGQEQDTIIGNTDNGNGTTVIPANHYAIITDQGTKFYESYRIPNQTICLYIDDAAICGNGLKNTGELLLLNNSHQTIIDAIEWGEDTPIVPGYPAYCVNKGESLNHHNQYTTNSVLRYTNGLNPTPGTKNNISISTPFLPKFLPKPSNPTKPGLPISLKLTLNHFKNNTTYFCKTYILGNLSNNWPASQTWNNKQWQYANNYTHIFTINQTRQTSQWIHIRLNPNYKEFQRTLRNTSHGYLLIKLKNQTHTYHYTQQIRLLDLSTYTTNATTAGYHIGQLNITQTIQENTPILLKDTNNTIIIAYILENNTISGDNTPTIPGYYKLAAPIGQDYIFQLIDSQNNYKTIQKEIKIIPGELRYSLSSPSKEFTTTLFSTASTKMILKNTGSFQDTYHLHSQDISQHWKTIIIPKKISLKPQEIAIITIRTTPQPPKPGISNTITLTIQSEKDPTLQKQQQITCHLYAPDLTITNHSLWNTENQKQTTYIQGQTIRIKIHLKNQGIQNASNVTIHYYLKQNNTNIPIEKIQYTNIGKFYKYPSIYLDTSDLSPGHHQIITQIDQENTILESDETNNKRVISFNLLPLQYDKKSSSIKINELFYHTYPNIDNEYIAIINPTQYTINLSGCYITNTPERKYLEQRKIFLPYNKPIPSKTIWYITQNATAFYQETGKIPHYEYGSDSNSTIPNLESTQTLRFSNTHGAIALKSPNNHTIDLIQYGETTTEFIGWQGAPLKNSGKGIIFKRCHQNGNPVDTNTSTDWKHPRIYLIGQSELPYKEIQCIGELVPFVSPDTSHSIITQEIKTANESIKLNMYEFTNPYLYEVLLNALKRNISLHIFMEGSPIGGIDLREQYILTSLAKNGAHIRFIISDSSNQIHARYRFDHAKYLIIDNKTVIVESCNWAKTGIPTDPSFGNREWGIVIRNPEVAQYFNTAFNHDYNPKSKDSCDIQDLDFQIPNDYMLDTTIYKGNYKPQFSPSKIHDNFTVIPVFSPDTSNYSLCNLIESAQESIYIQQLYIYPYWGDAISPMIAHLLEKAKEGLDIKVILNYNPAYGPTNDKQNITKAILTRNGIEVKYIYTNWSIFTNIHNKGMIVDNSSVLISSINWNENSILNNREVGVIIKNSEAAQYFSEVFFHDWRLNSSSYEVHQSFSLQDYSNQIIIVVVYVFTFALIIRDWRKRQWT